jgi:hypothetical protein
LWKAYPRARLALLAATCDLDHVKAAFRAGANAYLFTAMTAEALVRALELAMSGIVVLPNAVLAALCDGSQPPRRKPEGTADALDEAGCEALARPGAKHWQGRSAKGRTCPRHATRLRRSDQPAPCLGVRSTSCTGLLRATPTSRSRAGSTSGTRP